MSVRRDIRRCAVQALYQFDAGAAGSPEIVRDSLAGSPGGESTRSAGFELAQHTWARREEADAAFTEIAPQWPTRRQPVMDRTILRLAWFEMVSGRTPPKVVISEAVDLAREFSTDKSPMFINGVLDKLFRALHKQGAIPADAADPEDPAPPQAEQPSSLDRPAKDLR